MFYLVNRKGSFLSGYVPAGGREYIMYEGMLSQGEPKILKRYENCVGSLDEAWVKLCEGVSEARADGFLDMPIETSNLQLPADAYKAEFPLVHRCVYARVRTMTEEQFDAGLARLQTVHNAILRAGVTVSIATDGRSVELRLGQAELRFGFIPARLWDSMTGKARDLLQDRGIPGDNYLLPDGRGVFRLNTQETALDLYVRAFMQAAIEAGAGIDLTADGAWNFQASNPFLLEDVKTLEWYRTDPQLQSLAIKIDQTVAVPAGVTASLADFYC